MPVYDKDGISLASVYAKGGALLSQAYDVEGNELIQQTQIIKVMTYNVGQWYTGGGDNVPADKDAAYYALQNGMISRANPDVLLLQEYWKVFSKTGRTAKSLLEQFFPYIAEVGGTSGYAGKCICSKYPITNVVAASGNWNAKCTITIGNKQITFVSVHLAYQPESTRLQQLSELIPYLQTQPSFICGGDFNPLSLGNRSTSDADYIKIIKPLLDAGFHIANCGDFGFLETCSDEPEGTWWGCLDNIVTSSNIQILSATVDTTKFTDNIADKIDHMPLIAELKIGGA